MKEIVIEIPQYIRQVQLSNSTRPIFLEWDGGIIKPPHPFSRKKVPDKYFKVKGKKLELSNLNSKYGIGAFVGKLCVRRFMPYDSRLKSPSECTALLCQEGYITKGEMKRVKYLVVGDRNSAMILNPKKAGKPNNVVIKGQDIYSGSYNEYMRARIMSEIKWSFLSYVHDMPVITEYPIQVIMEVHDTVKNMMGIVSREDDEVLGQRWDLGNRAFPYGKAFLDLIVTGTINEEKVMNSKLVDDDRLHVTADPQGGIFFPLADNDDSKRKLVFRIIKDERDVIKNNKYFRKFYFVRPIFKVGETIKEDEKENSEIQHSIQSE